MKWTPRNGEYRSVLEVVSRLPEDLNVIRLRAHHYQIVVFLAATRVSRGGYKPEARRKAGRSEKQLFRY
jgi:hypothetical protein